MITIIVFLVFYWIISWILILVSNNPHIAILVNGKSVEIKITNTGRLPIPKCIVYFSAENVITGMNDINNFSAGLMPGKTASTVFDIKDSNCGCVNIELNKVKITDPLGIFGRCIDSAAENKVFLMPELKEIDFQDKDTEHYDIESFRYSDKRPGNDSGDTFGIKEYSHGDNVKAIHWKLSAKTGEIMIRQYGLPVDSKILVLGEKFDPKKKLSAEQRSQLTEYTLSISSSLVKLGISHYLGWQDDILKEFCLRKVENINDLESIIPDYISSPIYESGKWVCEEFIKSGVGAEYDFSSFILVSYCENGRELLLEYGETDLYTP